jgi:parallel beta-helix repeat protein
MVNNFQIVNIDIIVVPTIEGIFSNTASVTSIAQDPDSSNNNSTEITTVGVSASVIQSQIDAAVNGDTISVAPGTYIGTIDFLGKAINVVSEQGPLVTIIDGAESSSPVVNFVNGEGPGSVFNGFTVQNGGNGGINVSNASPMITNNIIQNNLKPGSGVGIEIAFSSATVSGNIIRGNDRGPGSGGGGGGISVRGAASAQILNNLIVDNLWGGGIDLFAAGTPLVQNNLISGNHGFGLGIANAMEGEIVQNLIVQNIGPGINNISVNGTFTGNTIALNSGPGINTFGFPIGNQFYNNIIVGAVGIPAIDCSNFGADIDPNLFRFNNVHSSGVSPYAGICTDQTGTNGNISVAPDFVDPANEDFRLNPTSLAIDAGDNMAPSLPVVDYLGSSRIVDGDQNGSSIVDMGAYEYIP